MPRFVVLSQAKNNSVIMISPEGTRSTSGLLAEFKKARARATAACACACERVLAPRVSNHMTPQGPFYMRENMGEKTGVLSATILGAYELWPVDGLPSLLDQPVPALSQVPSTCSVASEELKLV